MKKIILFNILVLIFSITEIYAQSWQKINNLPSGYNNNYYLDVFFLPSNPNYGWVCGFNSKILRTTNRGRTWQGVTINSFDYHLESIHFVNENVGYCSGVQGIFKSIDGGATWREITDNRMQHLWGCYFITEDVGVVVGEGCLDNTQKFWRTSDGGNSWTLSTTNEINSGMTDVILYDPNGLGYAVGSGKLYVTYDGGVNWEKFRDTETDFMENRWQEEITKYGASFLLPLSGYNYGGSSCQGGGYGGGIYFTTDSGDTWVKAQTSAPMYGTFLLDSVRGWACGYNGIVCHTEDAGRNWHIKNCGIFDNDLDDIWFINENEAWVVGRGIWKLSNDSYAFVPDSLYIKGVCYPGSKIDTLLFFNQSFNLASISFSITNDPDNNFSIVYPPIDNQVVLPPCGMIKLLVKFDPKSQGYKDANLIATVNDTINIFAKLEGFSSNSTITINSDFIDFDTVYANTLHSRSIEFSAIYPGEYISNIIPLDTNRQIFTDFIIDKEIGQIPFHLNFYIQSKDTGLIEKKFRINLQPCKRDTIITVCAYVKSSIINISDSVLTLNCPPISKNIIKVPIYNSGNANLKIDNIIINDEKAVFVGFASDRNMPAELEINEHDSILIGINLSPELVNDTINVTLVNNDSTRFYNFSPPPLLSDSYTIKPKNPYSIKLITKNWYSLIKTEAKDTNNFQLCYGDSVVTSFIVKNMSFSGGNYFYSSDTTNCTFKTIYKLDKDFQINSGEVRTYTLFIYPKNSGDFSLKLKFKSAYCDDTDSLEYFGYAENINIIPNPSSINISKKTKHSDSLYISLNSIGLGTLSLDSIRTYNSDSNLNLEFNYNNKIIYRDTTNFDFELTINTFQDGIFIDTLYFYYSGLCPKIVKIPITIHSTSADIKIQYKTKIDSMFCEIDTVSTFILVVNKGDKNIVIDSITVSNPAFTLDSYDFPFEISPEKEQLFKYFFTPTDTGSYNVIIKIYSKDLHNDVYVVETSAFYGLSNTSISNNFLDLDSLEYCDPIIYDTIVIKNDGNIACNIQIINNNQGIDISSENIIIQAFDSASIVVSVIPNEIEKPGENNLLINIIDNTCPRNLEYKINLFKIHKELSVQPNEINLESISANLDVFETAKVVNKSNVPIIIKSINLLGTSSQYISYNGINNGDILDINEERIINFKINAPELLNIDANFEIIYQSNCNNLNNINIKANTPEEIYRIKIYSEKYKKKPNENFDINIKIDESIPSRIAIDSIIFVLNFDRNLVAPHSISYNGNTISFNESISNNLIFSLVGKEANDFLSLKNQTISINSTAMISMPDTSTLDISSSKIFSSKKIIPEYENGFLSLFDYCPPIADLSRFEFFTASANISHKNDQITIDYSSSSNIQLEYQIIDQLARIIEKGYLPNLLNGIKILNNDLNNGIYFILVKYNNYVINQKLIINFK